MLDTLIGKLEEDPARSEIGPIAGVVVALAAGVVGEAARQSRGSWEGAVGATAQATAIRRRAIRLSRDDLEAHLIASDALDAALLAGGGHAAGDAPLAPALARAADLPLEIAEAAADVAELAAEVAEQGSPHLRADAAGAAMLAAGAVGAAAHLIDVNLSTVPEDERVTRARELLAATDVAGQRARAASA